MKRLIFLLFILCPFFGFGQNKKSPGVAASRVDSCQTKIYNMSIFEAELMREYPKSIFIGSDTLKMYVAMPGVYCNKNFAERVFDADPTVKRKPATTIYLVALSQINNFKNEVLYGSRKYFYSSFSIFIEGKEYGFASTDEKCKCFEYKGTAKLLK